MMQVVAALMEALFWTKQMMKLKKRNDKLGKWC